MRTALGLGAGSQNPKVTSDGNLIFQGIDENGNPASVTLNISDGAFAVSGLATKQTDESAGTYNTDILGYKIVQVGSGNWVMTAVNGGVATIASGDAVPGVYPEYLSSIVIPTGGQAVLYIP